MILCTNDTKQNLNPDWWTFLLYTDQNVVNAKDVWKLSPAQKKTLVIQAVRKGYVEAIEELKGYLRMYDQTREKYEVGQWSSSVNFY